jgi:hypothetical protein
MSRKPTKQPGLEDAVLQLASMFARNGCIRIPDVRRRKKERQKYHAGYEVRLVALDSEELSLATACVRALGLRRGSAFVKGSRTVLPLYGKDQVEKFCGFVRGAMPASVVAEKIPL